MEFIAQEQAAGQVEVVAGAVVHQAGAAEGDLAAAAVLLAAEGLAEVGKFLENLLIFKFYLEE